MSQHHWCESIALEAAVAANEGVKSSNSSSLKVNETRAATTGMSGKMQRGYQSLEAPTI